MKKTLLFNIIYLLCFSVLLNAQNYSAEKQPADPLLVLKDKSTQIKTDTDSIGGNSDIEKPVADPKEGFKDLFTEETTNGVSIKHLNPQAISFVQDYIKKQGKKMEEIKGWGKPYFDMIDAILIQHGLPKELKYLAVIESHLKVYAISWAGAVGPWQLMPGTARNLGLKVNSYIDERTDYYKSTHAAAKYLTQLYTLYGDWLLVIAAYNGGPGNVNNAIRKSGSRDFWQLQNYLPEESKNHVKKFIATHYIMEGEGGLTTLTKDETNEFMLQASADNRDGLSKEETANSQTISLTGKYNSLVIAKYLLMDITEFNRFNPGFDQLITANGSYEMRLSSDKMELFKAKKVAILNESIQLYLNSLSQPLYTTEKKQGK